jgi:N-acetylneuraminate synthase
VKFQRRKLDNVYRRALLDEPRLGEQGLQYIIPLLHEFELRDDDFVAIQAHCVQRGITFLCTPWDRSSVEFLVGLDVPALKIGSPDLTNFDLLECAASAGRPLIVSTGMSTEQEIQRTIAFLKQTGVPTVLLHCVSAYPPSVEELNLRFMHVLREWSGWPVGFSSHDTGLTSSLGAVALGACVLERHITMDRSMRGPDHAASLEPDQFAQQVAQVREVEKALGSPHRWVTQGEYLNRRTLGKSLVAATRIPEGVVIQRQMVAARSPGLGISPQRIPELVGQVARREIEEDTPFSEEDLVPSGAGEPLAPVQVGMPWGVIARFTDVDVMVELMAPQRPSVIEFHVSDRDLDIGLAGFTPHQYEQDLVVHAPEYCHDDLIDLCAVDTRVRELSLRRIQLTIDLARRLAEWFTGVGQRGPRVVIHAGGMAPDGRTYDVEAAYDRLAGSLADLDSAEVDLLVENLPPYPWFFGGRWFGHVLVDAESTGQFCARMGLGMCFDTSHAMLACNRDRTSLVGYAERVLPFVRHLHISDAAGVSGEGLQIGEGDINFTELLPLLAHSNASFVPEIWQGHQQQGRGFRIALERLGEIAWALRCLEHVPSAAAKPTLAQMVVPVSASLARTLELIDQNKLGTAFVAAEGGAVVGLVTDGDIRRALLRGTRLDRPVSDVMVEDFVFASAGTPPTEIQGLLSGEIRVVPILDRERRLIDFATIFDSLPVSKRPA